MPCGSGNDFALTFKSDKSGKKIDTKARINACVESIITNNIKFIDLIKIEVNTIKRCDADYSFSETTCINIANIGLDARIVQNAAAYKKTFGSRAYLAAVYKSIAEHKNIRLKITADGVSYEGLYTLAAVCNGQYYGGGMRIAPNAEPDDGQMTVCLIDAISRPKIMALFPSILIEKHTRLKFIHYINCKSLVIEAIDGEVLCVDGNLYNCAGTVTFNIMPRALRVFAP